MKPTAKCLLFQILELQLKDSMQISFEKFSSETGPKQKLWEEKLKHLDLIRDRLGQPIDQGIKETCAAFIVNGLPTTQSCEGHLNEGVPYPWVDIGPEYEDLGNDLNKKREFVDVTHRAALEKTEMMTQEHFHVDEIDYENTEVMRFYDRTLKESLDPLYRQYGNEVKVEEQERTRTYIQKLNILFKVYTPIDTEFAYTFDVSPSGTRIRIQPVRAEIFEKATQTEKIEILEKTHLEMSAITKILKNFFEN